MVSEILKRYLDRIAPQVGMQEEKELAEKYLRLFEESEKEVQIEKAN
jgi:hypothetical protein